jgi:protocatechuate 3,4-dioxygenase beta subunit
MDCVVTVVDTLGRPIRGAEVSVWGHNYDSGLYSSVVERLFPETETSAEGEVCVRFEPNTTENNLFIFAQKPGFSVGWNGVHRVARITEIRIVLDRIHSTAGIVTDEENQPIAGAKVTAYPVETMVDGAQSHLRWPDSIFTTKTDHEGRFSFDCLAEWMEVSFRVEYPGRAYTDTNYNIDGERVRCYKAGQKDIHITMQPASQIKGRILAKRGKKIEGIKLMAKGERIRTGKRFESVSDADGRFSFGDLPPDVYLVTTIADGDDPLQQITAGAIAEVEVGETVEKVKIRMRDPIQLDVLVKDTKTDQPVPNARVYLGQAGASKIVPHWDFRTTTDNRGIARIITLPGKFSMGAGCDQYDGFWGEYLARSTDTHFMIGINPHSTVTGKVVYENGRAAAGVEVEVSTHESERKLTDGSGRFRIMFSEDHAQRGFIIARDIEKGLAGIVDITEHEGPARVVLKKAATLKGRVVDPGGKPIERARMQFSLSIPHYSKFFSNCLYTDENGRYELRAIPYTQQHFGYRVSASAYGYSVIRHEKIDVKEGMGDIVELAPLILKPRNMTVSGKVVYPDGTVAAHKYIYLGSHNLEAVHTQPKLHSVTDETGKFYFDGVCDGWAEITCGSVLQNDCGLILAKGGDTLKIVMNNDHDARQVHTVIDSLQGLKLPMYEMLTKGVDPETLENKKLLICFWWMSNDKAGIKNAKQLSAIVDEINQAGIYVLLVNARPFPVGNKWLKKHKVRFAEAGISAQGDVLEFRRAVGARFLPHLILTDENKVIINEGFDVQWLKDNVLVKEGI